MATRKSVLGSGTCVNTKSVVNPIVSTFPAAAVGAANTLAVPSPASRQGVQGPEPVHRKIALIIQKKVAARRVVQKRSAGCENEVPSLGARSTGMRRSPSERARENDGCIRSSIAREHWVERTLRTARRRDANLDIRVSAARTIPGRAIEAKTNCV